MFALHDKNKPDRDSSFFLSFNTISTATKHGEAVTIVNS
jgi:hypothetical protein